MTIDQINGSGFTPHKPGKGDSASKANEGKSSPAAKGTSGQHSDVANLSLSDSIFDNEIEFTRNALSNIRHESIDSLKNIKQKIDAGAYNSDEVHREMSSAIEKELPNLTNIFSHSSNAGNAPATISDYHKERLLNDPDVIKKVSETIVQDLQGL